MVAAKIVGNATDGLRACRILEPSATQSLTSEQAKGQLPSKIIVLAPARVHFGLFQLSQAYPTLNMGVGASVTYPRWILEASRSKSNTFFLDSCDADVAQDVEEAARALMGRLTIELNGASWCVKVIECVPSHVGFGSKTALLCAITAAASALTDSLQFWPERRDLTGRGGTSGIGINTSVVGGIILDSGHDESVTRDLRPRPSRLRAGKPMPMVAARWRPPHWPVVLITPHEAQSHDGKWEEEFFRSHTPLSTAEVQKVAATVLYEIIPALSQGSYSAIAKSFHNLQLIGFKRREWEAQPETVQKLREELAGFGVDCLALSSVGPSIVAFSKDSLSLLRRLEGRDDISVRISSLRSTGIKIWALG